MTTPSWPSNFRRIPRIERCIDPDIAKRAVVAGDALVSVLVTTHNSAHNVSRALNSLGDQDHRNIEVLIIDDCSTDNTTSVISKFCSLDPRFRLISLPMNRGTYWAKNVGLLEARGTVITFMDSDDYSVPTRISEQIKALADSGKVASICNCVRIDERGEIVLNRGLRERIAPISLMFKRQVTDDIGFFDTVRTSADVEFQDRIKLTYGRSSLAIVAKPLYEASVRSESLTNSSGNGVNLKKTSSFLSPARQSYSDRYQEWHSALKAQGVTARMPFPLTHRPFQVEQPLKVQPGRFDHDPIFAFMASFPPRIKSLEQSVRSLVRQVDHLYIYLNGYDHIPKFLDDERITALPAHNLEDLRDVGKTYHMSGAPSGYYFTVDDDIFYPEDYCEKMVRSIERYNRDTVVGVHGVIFEIPFTKYFSPDRLVYHFRRKLDQDEFVNLLGTGTTAFHSSTIRLNHTLMPKGMLDIGLAVTARRSGIPMVTLARDDMWLRPLTPDDEDTPNLFDEFRNDDSEQTRLLREIHDWTPLRSRTEASANEKPTNFSRREHAEDLPHIVRLREEIDALERERVARADRRPS